MFIRLNRGCVSVCGPHQNSRAPRGCQLELVWKYICAAQKTLARKLAVSTLRPELSLEQMNWAFLFIYPRVDTIPSLTCPRFSLLSQKKKKKNFPSLSPCSHLLPYLLFQGRRLSVFSWWNWSKERLWVDFHIGRPMWSRRDCHYAVQWSSNISSCLGTLGAWA